MWPPARASRRGRRRRGRCAAWGFETVGRRAAAGVLRRCGWTSSTGGCTSRRPRSTASQSAEVATTAVAGVDALETAFARYLPQVVLAVVVPVAVIALVASIDLVSAGLMLVTLPLVPVFMWLVGRYTEHRTRSAGGAVLLSTHFLDVVRGLPTLRAFNRGEAQAEQIAEVCDSYRRTTMGTLRVAFLSGAVLELAATLGVALVAVTVGVRLVNGGIGLEAGLTVLVLAPELYLPLRKLACAVPRERRRAGGCRAAPRSRRSAGGRHRRPGRAAERSRDGGPARGRLVRVSGARLARCSRASTSSCAPARRSRSWGRAAAGSGRLRLCCCASPSRPPGRVRSARSTARHCDADAWRAQLAWVPQRPTMFHGTVAENIRLGAPDAPRRSAPAAVAAGADGFVTELPDGYETVVGDGGRALSAGQGQRIALARALSSRRAVRRSSTSRPRTSTRERRARRGGVERLRRDRTVLLIAQPRLAGRADRSYGSTGADRRRRGGGA